MSRRHVIRTGETINDLKLLDHKYEKNKDGGKENHYYLIQCLLCSSEKWMSYASITSTELLK